MARPIPGRVSLLLLASLLPQSVATMTKKNCTERTLGCKTSCGVLKSLDSKLLSSAINSSSSALKLFEPCRFCKCRKCQTCIAAWHAGRTPWATAATSVTGKRIYLHPASYTRPVVRRAVKHSVGKDVREVEGGAWGVGGGGQKAKKKKKKRREVPKGANGTSDAQRRPTQKKRTGSTGMPHPPTPPPHLPSSPPNPHRLAPTA